MKARYKLPNGTVMERDIPGIPGKSAYQYAVDGGYTGTPEEFAKKLAAEVPTKNSQLENDSDYAPRSELPKAFYVEYFDGELNKPLAEIGEAYNAGSVVFGAFAFSDDSQFVAIMTYFFAEEGNIIAALFNGWSAGSVKRQVIIQVTDEGSGISVDINDDATFASVDDIDSMIDAKLNAIPIAEEEAF